MFNFSVSKTLFNSALVLLAVTVSALAVPQPAISPSQCNSGNIQCCDVPQSDSTGPTSSDGSSIPVLVPGLGVPVGATCNQIPILGISGTSCTSQPLCCEGNSGTINCVPVNLSL